MKRRLLIIAGIIAVILSIAGVAVASIPDSLGVIHGCYAKDGSLTVIDTDAGQVCGKGQTGLTWNQVGPAGPQGATGAQGPAGATGAAGPAGVSGYEVDTYTPSANGGNGDNPLGSFSSANGSEESFQLYCPAGKTAISSGWSERNNTPNLQPLMMMENFPFSDAGGSGYRFTAVDYASQTPVFSVITLYVTCANAS